MGKIKFRKNEKGCLLLVLLLIIGASAYYGNLGEITQDETISLIDQGRYLQFETQTGAVITMRPAMPRDRLMHLLAILPSSVDPGDQFTVQWEWTQVDTSACEDETAEQPGIGWFVDGDQYSDAGVAHLGFEINFPTPHTMTHTMSYRFPTETAGGSYTFASRINEQKSGAICTAVSNWDEGATTVTGEGSDCNYMLESYRYMCQSGKLYERGSPVNGCYRMEDIIYRESCAWDTCTAAYSNSLPGNMCPETSSCIVGEFKCDHVSSDIAQISVATTAGCDWSFYNSKSGTCRHGSGNSCDGSVDDCIVLTSEEEEEDKDYEYWTIVGGQCVSTKSDESSPPEGYYRTETLCKDAITEEDENGNDDPIIKPPEDDENGNDVNGGPSKIENNVTTQRYYAIEDDKCVLKNEVVTAEMNVSGWTIIEYGETGAKVLCEEYLKAKADDNGNDNNGNDIGDALKEFFTGILIGVFAFIFLLVVILGRQRGNIRR